MFVRSLWQLMLPLFHDVITTTDDVMNTLSSFGGILEKYLLLTEISQFKLLWGIPKFQYNYFSLVGQKSFISICIFTYRTRLSDGTALFGVGTQPHAHGILGP